MIPGLENIDSFEGFVIGFITGFGVGCIFMKRTMMKYFMAELKRRGLVK